MDGGAGGAGAHYCDADLGEGESTCWREVTLSARCGADKSASRRCLDLKGLSCRTNTLYSFCLLCILTPSAAVQPSVDR